MNEETTVDRSVEIEAMSAEEIVKMSYSEALASILAEDASEALAQLVSLLDTRHAAEIAPLDQEREALLKEHSAIGQAAEALEDVLPAQARIAQAESDRLIVAGDMEAAQLKAVEMEKAKRAPMAMRQRQETISLRVAEIEREKQRIARDLFAEWYERDVQPVARAAEKGLADLLDGLKASFYQYQERHQLGGTLANPYGFLVKESHISNLTGDVRGVWGRLNVWYGGRNR